MRADSSLSLPKASTLWTRAGLRPGAVALIALLLGAHVAFVTDASRAAPSRQIEPSVQLTASDGAGLDLVAVDARGVLEGPIAFTELRLTFQNPRPEEMEGRFQILLPTGAAISRFAMKIDGEWQEGEVVERRHAQQIYEDFLHRSQDPALLEQESANQFSARVFPIPALGLKELIVSYSHALTDAADAYVIPLRGLSQIDRLDVRVQLGSRIDEGTASNLGGRVRASRLFELHKTDWVPDRDFEVRQDPATRHGLRYGNLVALRLEPDIEASQAPVGLDGLAVLVDSSASRALDFEAQVITVSELLGSLPVDTPVSVAAFDQQVSPVYEGTAGDFGAPQMETLRRHGALGASDLVGALRWLAQRDSVRPRLLVFTDGAATAGDPDAETPGVHLPDARDALGRAGVRRIDAVVFGGLRDEAALRRLVTGGSNAAGRVDGQVIDGDVGLTEILRRLREPCASGLDVVVEGAEWVWPRTLDGIQPGDQVLVYADLPADRSVRVTVGGRPVRFDGVTDPSLSATERPLLHRAWVQARMDRLLHLRDTDFADDQDMRRAIVSEVTDLSVEHRVLSPYTAFLVLETEDDYRQYELDRRGLSDILTVGPSGLEVMERSISAPPPAEPAAEPEAETETETANDTANETVTETAKETGAEDPDDPRPTLSAEELEETIVVTSESARAELDSLGYLEGTSDMVLGLPVAPPLPERVEAAPILLEEPPPAPRRTPPSAPSGSADLGAVPWGSTPGTMQDRISTSPVSGESTFDDSTEVEERLPPHTGRFAEIMELLERDETKKAVVRAEDWNRTEPGNVLALVALGMAHEAAGDTSRAARAYASLIDLFPSRADLRRFAGELLDRLAAHHDDGSARALAIDTYRRALQQRPDHPSSHRQLAWALVAAGRYADAFAAVEAALSRDDPESRFDGVERILREDLGLIAAAWLAEHYGPGEQVAVRDRLRRLGTRVAESPSLRFVLTWETDANDVDLHIWDARGGHADYDAMKLRSGGELFADVTDGFGPECFAIPGPGKAAPYRVQAHYYNRGAMGFGLGTLHVIEHDGTGGLRLNHRPFVIMVDDGWVDLGEWPAER